MINVYIYPKKINVYSDSDIYCSHVYVYLHVHKSTHALFCVLFMRSIHVGNECVQCADEQNRQYHCSYHSPAPPMTWEDDAHALGIKSSSGWSWPRDSGEESSPGHTN